MRHIEVRRAVFQVRTRAVIRLRGIILEVFAIAGGIKRLRPGVVHYRSHSAPIRDTHTGLQRVVIRLRGGFLMHEVKGREWVVIAEHAAKNAGYAKAVSLQTAGPATRKASRNPLCERYVGCRDRRLIWLVQVSKPE